MPKQLWLLAGGNGAGKSTFYRLQLAPLELPFINADVIAREVFPNNPEAHSYQAAQIAQEMRNELIIEGRSFCFETVFSHPSKIDFVAKAKSLGYEIILVFIHLETFELNKARIAQRIEEGGHFVPDEKVESRIPRTLQHIRTVLPLCDHVRLLDNSLASDPFRPISTYQNNYWEHQQTHLPSWANFLLHFVKCFD